MGFRREMTDPVNLIFRENGLDGLCVADIRFLKDIAPGITCFHACEIFGIPRIGKLVHIDNPAVEIRLLKNMLNKIGPDKTTATGHHQISNIHLRFHLRGRLTSKSPG